MFNQLFTIVAGAAILSTAPAGTSAPALRIERHATFFTDSVRVANAIAEAERLAAIGRVADAGRRLRDAIGQQQAAGEYPGSAMWHLANVYYGDGREIDAARVLDDLGDAASEFGDPVTELRARFESAVIYSHHGLSDRVVAQLAHVRKLLLSPVVDDATKLNVRERMGER